LRISFKGTIPEKLLALVAEIEHLLAADEQRKKSADRALREGNRLNENG
jgi:hypothetical protein